jgi:uncharacterized protein YwgA
MVTTDDRVYHLIKLLLYTARKEGAEVTPIKFQKIFFLLEKEKGVNLGLDYKPWLFGAYSSKLQDYLDRLMELGEVGEEVDGEVRDPISGEVVAYKRHYVLNVEFEPTEEDKEFEVFFVEWVKKSKTEIMNYAYRKYPEYFEYSRIRENVLGKLKGS